MKSVVRDGRAAPRAEDIPRPAPRSGCVLVRTCVSLVSGGTERSVAEFAGLSLAGKAMRRPDLVRQVADKVRRDGVVEAHRAVRSRLQVAESLGYSCAGIVEEDGTGAYAVGALVACAGGGHATHAEYNLVPRNLVAAAPAGVSAEHAAFAAVGSVALHAVRLTRGGLGDAVGVVGLGLIGQLAVQLLKAAGCTVFGFDPLASRSALAHALGADFTDADPDAFARTVAEATRGRGVDGVLVAASSRDSGPVALGTQVARGRARLVVLGDTQLHLDRRPFYEKELELVVSRSYGPGRYDPDYEERGIDYPLEYVRWTLQRNMEAFLELAGHVRVEPLVTHRFPIADADAAYRLLTGERKEPHLGILLVYPDAARAPATPPTSVALAASAAPAGGSAIGVSVLGAGNYARATLLPALAKIAGVERVSIVTAKGLSAWDAGRRFGFARCSTDVADGLGAETRLAVVATRHSGHAALVRRLVRAGKAVFVEKPLCVSADELATVAEEYEAVPGAFVMVGYNRRFAPLVVRARACLAAVGRPLVLSYRVNAGALPAGSWVLAGDEGGGRLVGEACHFVDLLMHLAAAPPVRVHAVRPTRAGQPADAETFTAMLEFANGCVGTLVYSADGDAAHPKERLEIVGGGAVLVLDDFRTLTVTHQGRRRRYRPWGRDKGHVAELQATVDAVRSGAREPIPFGEAVRGMRAVFAIETSLATGGAVEVG